MENIEVKNVKLKLKDIVNAIEKIFVEQRKEKNDKAYEDAVREFKATDFIYTNLVELAKDKDEELKTNLLSGGEKYLNLKIPKKFAYTTYDESETIKKQAAIYLMDNPNCTFKELYDFCTKDLNNE